MTVWENGTSHKTSYRPNATNDHIKWAKWTLQGGDKANIHREEVVAWI